MPRFSIAVSCLALAVAGAWPAAAQEVKLPLAEYEGLRSRANPAPEAPPEPPAPFALELAELEIKAGPESARVAQTLRFTLYDDAWRMVPLGEAGSFIRADFGGGEGRVRMAEDGWSLEVRGRGRHEVKLESVLPVTRDETATRPTWRLGFKAPAAAVVRGRLEVPEGVEDVDPEGAVLVERLAAGGWRFAVPAGSDVRWTLSGKAVVPRRAQLPLRFEATTATASTVLHTRFRVLGWVEARVAQGRLERLRVPIPAGLKVVNVRGPADWKMDGETLAITPLSPVEGSLAVEIDLTGDPRGSFTVDLPEGLAIEKAGTDEGDVLPVVDSRRLTVHRRSQLRGTGYLVLTSTPPAGASLPLDPVKPETTVRARYLALSSSVAAGARPLPEGGWQRVDLDDLPSMLRDALSALDLSAAWRLTGVPTGLAMAVSPLPAAPVLPSVVRRRETTTLLTVDGTLLHRDRLILRPTAGLGATVDLVLPPAALLWSAKVDDLPVRPLVRGGDTISVPLGFETGKESVVEVVAVLEKAIPRGRSELALVLPRVAAPVQEHEWRVLLPDGNRYRFRSGSLRPAALPPAGRVVPADLDLEAVPTSRDPWEVLQKAPGVLTDRINTGGNESGQQSMYAGPGGSSTLRARVVDERGDPLSGALVTIFSSGATVGVTDTKGFVTFVALPSGNLQLKAEMEGFSAKEYTDIHLSAGETKSVDIPMSTAVEDVITVGETPPPLNLRRHKPESPAYYDFDSFGEMAKGLQQGLVGGVKPLNVAIPETGKVLLLTGILPPAEVAAELEVKAQKR